MFCGMIDIDCMTETEIKYQKTTLYFYILYVRNETFDHALLHETIVMIKK